MNTLQSAAVAAATAFLVLAFCTGIKAACRKKLRQDKNDKAIHDGYMGAKMKIYTFGKKENPAVMLLPGTCCHWKSFEGVIPKLSENFYVLCVSYDGFDETEHAVVISNALHIMPEPEKALAEIRRVLKPGGILIAPTFTAAGSLSGRMRIRFMELSGFKVFYKWTPQGYLDFLEENGFEIVRRKTFDGGLKLTYAEARVKP